MYAIIIVPQQRRVKKQQALLSSLAEGDEVITTSGIYGEIVEIDGDELYVDIGGGIEIRMVRSAVEAKVGGSAVTAGTDDSAEDDSDEADAGEGDSYKKLLSKKNVDDVVDEEA